VGAAEEPPVDDEPAADPGAEGDEDELVDAARRPEPVLGDGRRVGVVREHDRAPAEPCREHGCHVGARRARQVGADREDAVAVEHAGEPDADGEAVERPACLAGEVVDGAGDRVGDHDPGRVLVGRGRVTRLGVHRPLGVREHREDLGPADVDADGEAGHASDSARAFSSRSAVPWIRWAARCFTNPGIGTRSSTSSW